MVIMDVMDMLFSFVVVATVLTKSRIRARESMMARGAAVANISMFVSNAIVQQPLRTDGGRVMGLFGPRHARELAPVASAQAASAGHSCSLANFRLGRRLHSAEAIVRARSKVSRAVKMAANGRVSWPKPVSGPVIGC